MRNAILNLSHLVTLFPVVLAVLEDLVRYALLGLICYGGWVLVIGVGDVSS